MACVFDVVCANVDQEIERELCHYSGMFDATTRNDKGIVMVIPRYRICFGFLFRALNQSHVMNEILVKHFSAIHRELHVDVY